MIFISSFLTLHAQNVNEQKYKLAESFESNGDYEGALRLYSELIKDEPKTDQFFDAYVRVMKALNKYSELLSAVTERLTFRKNLIMLDLYAELNWRTGNTDEANKTWNEAISNNENSQSTYLQVSQTQINLRLFEKAVSTLLMGRKAIGDPQLFSDPLTKLYIAVGDYKSGTSEIISVLGMDFNLPQAQGRLFALMINQDAKDYVGEELRKISNDNKNNIIYQEAYSWFLRTTGNNEEALEIVVRIDEVKKTNGSEILNFATTASRDGDYEIALKAFRIIINKGKVNNPYASSALYGFTRALEQKMSAEKSNISKESANELIDSYNKIIDDFPKTGNAADSRLRLATIYSEILNDQSKAIQQLDKLIKEFPSSQYTVSAYLGLGKIYLVMDNLEKAELSFTKVKEFHRFANAEQKDQALYQSALIAYYIGDIEKSTNAFQLLSLNPDADISNDVLNKLFIINSNLEKVAALELYAKSELKQFQGKSKEALELLKEVSRLAEKSMLGELALIKSAEIQLKLGDFSSCRVYLSEFYNTYPESKQNDRRIMLTADSYYEEKNFGEALKFYTELITKYPDSIYLQEARTRIRIIRKDHI